MDGKVTSKEQKVMSNKQKVTSNEQKVMSDKLKVTNSKQNVTSNKQKITSNEQKVHLRHEAPSFLVLIIWQNHQCQFASYFELMKSRFLNISLVWDSIICFYFVCTSPSKPISISLDCWTVFCQHT